MKVLQLTKFFIISVPLACFVYSIAMIIKLIKKV